MSISIKNEENDNNDKINDLSEISGHITVMKIAVIMCLIVEKMSQCKNILMILKQPSFIHHIFYFDFDYFDYRVT